MSFPTPPAARHLVFIWYRLEHGPYEPHHPGAPVALLISSRTGSAGEGALVALLGQPGTRVFGIASAGVPTAPEGFFMVDGANLEVASARSRDRLGRLYDGPIAPDEMVFGFPGGGADQVLRAATRWLLRQQECERPHG